MKEKTGNVEEGSSDSIGGGHQRIASARTNGDMLARFEGGIGVIPAANGAGPANPDGTLPNVKLNVVRGVPPGAGPWRIADLKAEIDTDGRIRVRGAACFWRAATVSARTPIKRLRDADLRGHRAVHRAQHVQRAARSQRRLSHRRCAESGADGMRQSGAADPQQGRSVVRRRDSRARRRRPLASHVPVTSQCRGRADTTTVGESRSTGWR